MGCTPNKNTSDVPNPSVEKVAVQNESSQMFSKMLNKLTHSDDSYTMLTKEFWPDFFEKFSDHYMNTD